MGIESILVVGLVDVCIWTHGYWVKRPQEGMGVEKPRGQSVSCCLVSSVVR